MLLFNNWKEEIFLQELLIMAGSKVNGIIKTIYEDRIE